MSVDVNATVSDVVGVLGNFSVSKENVKVENTDLEKQKNSFSILILTAKEKTKLPDKWNESSERNKLKIRLIDWLQSNGVGWSLQEKDFLGVQFINTLSSVLWDIDGNQSTLSERGCGVPGAFSVF